MRKPWCWTDFQLNKLHEVNRVLADFSAYKPLTLRQIFYQLVAKQVIENNKAQYDMLSKLLKWARIDGHVSWDDIEDRVRTLHLGDGWPTKDAFVEDKVRSFLKGYRRHLIQDQDYYPEVWIEKDALAAIVSRVARGFCISTVVCRGFASVTFLNDYRERIQGERQAPVMLYFGDFDPSGMKMLDAMRETLEHELGVDGVIFDRIALNWDQVDQYDLPDNPDALKRKDPRTAEFVRLYGRHAVELDALPPDVLKGLVEEAILKYLDVERFNRQVRIHNREVRELSRVRGKVLGVLRPKAKGRRGGRNLVFPFIEK
jgi:hypothetical protein